MIWSKTDAGRVEIQARAIVKERAQRNLLLVIDGIKTDEMLLANLAGITADDFLQLQTLGLIAPVPAGVRPGTAAPRAAPPPPPPPPPTPAMPSDYGQFTASLTELISRELGLRGFGLTLAVEKAGNSEELQAVAQRALAQIAERKGELVAAEARRILYGS